MITMSTEWRYANDGLAITKNQHEPNRYSKSNLFEDNIFKRSMLDSSWVTRYFLLSLTITTTSWSKETRKPPPIHDKQLQKYPPPQNKLAYVMRLDEIKILNSVNSESILRWCKTTVKGVAQWKLYTNCVDCSTPIKNWHNYWGLHYIGKTS